MSQVRLEAIPTIQNSEVVGWELCLKDPPKQDVCGDGSAQRPYPVVDLGGNPTNSASVIHIKIAENDLGVVFAQNRPDGDGPLWIQRNTKPTAFVIGPSDQIPRIKVTGGGSKNLQFVDNNSGDAMTLKYQLNFIDGRSLPVKGIDPEIKNGGTNPPPPPPPPPGQSTDQKCTNGAPGGYLGQIGGLDLGALLIGLLIGLIIGLVLCRMRK